MTGRTAATDHLAGYADVIAAACVTGRRLSRDELESRRTEGERAAEAGLPLRGLIRDHPAAQNVRLAASSSSDTLLSVVERAVDAFLEG